MNVEDRIREVCDLKKGWLYPPQEPGEDIDVDPNQVIRIVKALMDAGFEKPNICPTPDGLVELEWDDGLSIEIHTCDLIGETK